MPKNFEKYKPMTSKVNDYALVLPPEVERASRYRDGKAYKETMEMSHIYPMYDDGFNAKRTVDEDDIEVIETYCTACGKQLTRTEKLFGNRCINHSIKERRIF